MLKMQELNEKSNEQLENLCDDLRSDIYKLKTELAVSRKVEKPHLIREKRHTIARAMGLLSLRQRSSKEG